MIEPFVMLGMIAVAISVAYYIKNRESKKYIWIGTKGSFKERK